MPLLSVQNLSIGLNTRRGRVTVIDDLSIEVDAGEILGVVGESGAGKSLTGMAILRLLDPPLAQSGGEIRFDGRRIDTLSSRELDAMRGKDIAAVFQDSMTSLNPIMSIGNQLVETILAHLPLTRREAAARAVQLLTEVGIPGPRERLAAYPHQLSGGMRQRVVLALAFASEPRLIIADEPTTALDVSLQAQIVSLLKTMAEERGAAIIFITHDMGLIAEIADRVAVLYAGRIAEIGPTAAVLESPRHPYTKSLIASIPRMNRPMQRLFQIEGVMPRPGDRPCGCAFHPRCPVAIARCPVEPPPLLAHDGSSAACWLLDPSVVLLNGVRQNA
ncbi:MAG TPA: ABC transporter ATP-binding protein [Hyphomicrobiales bacterium]|jgi:peptide/nickel transport system ATP-binding protein